MAKRANNEGSIYRTPDGRWHALVSLGEDGTGKRIRRHVSGTTQRDVKHKFDQLLRDRDAGHRVAETRVPTVGEWAESWFGVVERTRKPSTTKTYRTHLKYLEPIGRLRIDRVTTEAIEQLYVGLVRRGVKPISVHSAHRTFRSCFNEAVTRGWLNRNPVKAARPDTAQEHRAILAVAEGERNGVRWAIALGLGLRQGEVLVSRERSSWT